MPYGVYGELLDAIYVFNGLSFLRLEGVWQPVFPVLLAKRLLQALGTGEQR